MSMTYNKPFTERLLPLYYTEGLKDLLTVDQFSVYLLWRVDRSCYLLTRVVIRYIEVDSTFGLPDYVRYIEVLFHTFYCNFGRDLEYRSLYRGLR